VTIGGKNKEKTHKIWWFEEKSVSLQQN